MQLAFSVPAALLLLCSTLFAHSAALAPRPETFHVRGTITDPIEGVIPGVTITFQNQELNKTVATNNIGVYEADLPPGDYTMTAQGPRGFRLYRRPLFRGMPQATLVLNATLLVAGTCGDFVIGSISGEPITDEQVEAATPDCGHEKLISLPSADGAPFQLSIHYGSRTPIDSTYSYTGEKNRQYHVPVFVAYNQFTLQADRVIYDSQKQTIEASGNVVAVNDAGTTQRADSLAFKIENGKVTLIR